MTTLAQLRKTALSFPETTEEGIGDRMVAFTVRDKRFASTDRDGCVLLHLRGEDADKVLFEHPTAERVTRGATSIGVRVPFKDINGQQLNHWVRRAWISRAPKNLAEQITAADTAAAGEIGDLPKAIGRPATAALVSAGITTLAQLAERAETELLDMHGVGPKAIRILNEALRDSGRSFKA
jgi:hypothetical protein